MILFLHGQLGGYDELVILLIGFVVLWVTIKIAGRKPKAGDGAAPAEQDDGIVDDGIQDEAPTPTARP